MTDMPEILQMAHQLARHAGARQTVIARNVAHADTPGYRAADIAGFAETYRSSGALPLRATRPGHLGAAPGTAAPQSHETDTPAAPNGNTVSLEEELLRAADTKRSHDLALAVYRSALGLLRTSLGRQ